MRALEGVRIADFTLHAAGPFCTHMLSLLGAECIKIESAMRPDIFRRPHPVYGRMGAAEFDQVASGKRSVTLNLKDPRGAELAKRLVAISDVAVESFRPGVMERLWLSYGELQRVKRDIVLVSISASGQTGPEKGYAGYAPLFGALGGLGHLTGYEDGPPVEIRHIMDHSTGLSAAVATLAALYSLRQTGRGQHVDVAAREVASSFVGDALLDCALNGRTPFRQGNDDPVMAPHGVYPCRGEDEWISIAVKTDEEWQALVEVVGNPGWLDDPRFADRAVRWGHRLALDEEISAWTCRHTRWEAAGQLQAVGVAAFPSYNARDIVEDEHLRTRGVICDLTGPQGQSRAVVGTPWRFSHTPARLDSWTPALGEHNHYVFGELLGIDEGEIRLLIEEQVIY